MSRAFLLASGMLEMPHSHNVAVPLCAHLERSYAVSA